MWVDIPETKISRAVLKLNNLAHVVESQSGEIASKGGDVAAYALMFLAFTGLRLIQEFNYSSQKSSSAQPTLLKGSTKLAPLSN